MTTFHDQIKDKQPVAKFEQQTRSNQSDIQFITNLNSFLSIIPLISSANAQGHPGMDRSWAILNLLEEQSNENHISIKYSPKKNARLCGYLPGDNQQHHTGSGNECHEWFLRLCKQERNFHQIRSNSSKILEGTTQKMIEKASHFG